MAIDKYDELNNMHIDVLREIGSIGSGNAATSLSKMLDKKISISLPQVMLLENNEAVKRLGGPEKIISAVLVKFTGEIEGIVLYFLNIEFINIILKNVLSETIESYEQLSNMEISALKEIGNIIISSYVSAISDLTGLSINLSVPAICINMMGAIMSVPMVEYGYASDKLMIIGSNIISDGHEIESNLIMIPDIESLNTIMDKLGVPHE